MSDDLLKSLYEDQRKELEYRRNREYQVFTWSATVFLALIGAALVSRTRQGALAHINESGAIIGCLSIILFTAYILLWLLHQRRCMRAHQRVLAQIALKRGWFFEAIADGSRPILPQEWRELGNADNGKVGGLGKMAITGALGTVAVVIFWISTRQ